jgi:acyl-CoA synthetase (AMP-forming)/AMP-acid ligase II
MIKTAGANVFPAEVEKAIAKVTDGLVAHVIGLPDPERGQVVAVAVVVANGQTFDDVAVCEKLKDELSAYKIPRRFVALTPGQVPLMPSGKVDLARLVAVFDG